jgi:hypothetical protein
MEESSLPTVAPPFDGCLRLMGNPSFFIEVADTREEREQYKHKGDQ